MICVGSLFCPSPLYALGLNKATVSVAASDSEMQKKPKVSIDFAYRQAGRKLRKGPRDTYSRSKAGGVSQ